MLQGFTTLVSSMLAIGALALIVSLLAQDWRMVMRAIRNSRQFHPLPLPVLRPDAAGARGTGAVA